MVSKDRQNVRIHPTADVSAAAIIGEGTSIWHECQVRERAHIGTGCILGKGVYVDFDVRIGDNCKIQNRASVYHGTTLGDGVFVGPHVIFTNDKLPRAINADGSRKSDDDWEIGPINVGTGASLGAGSILLPNVNVGTFALVGAGAVVTRNVPNYAIVVGNPAKFVGYACACGTKLQPAEDSYTCPSCGRVYYKEGGELIQKTTSQEEITE